MPQQQTSPIKDSARDSVFALPVFDAPGDDAARVAITEDGRIVYASRAFCTLLRREEDDIRAMKVADILALPRAGGGLENMEAGVRPLRIPGTRKSVSFHFEWLSTPDQRRYLIGSPAQDEAGAARILPQTDFQGFQDLSHDLMLVLNRAGEILRANDVFYALFGANPDKNQGRDFTELFQSQDREAVQARFQALAFDEGAKLLAEFEAHVRTESGETRCLEWRQRREGELIYCIARDVTDTKNQTEALRRRENQLLQAESIGRMGHWHWTVGENKVEFSDELYRVFGVDKSFEPTLDNISAMVSRRDIPRAGQMFQRAIIEQNNYDMDFRINRPDASTRYIRCEGRCALDEGGEVVALYGIMQDMTERTLYEQQLREAKRLAERAYAAKSQFLANMSHELRTPLNAIIGFSEMMQQQLLGPIGTEKYMEYIDGIRQSGGHLLDLISDILDMSKIEAGKYELALEEFNVYKTLRMALHMMEGRALESGVKISLETPPSEKLSLIADRRAFMQIALNILSNAVKFTKAGGEVSVECHERTDYLALKVRDTGIGIPANKLATITRPFEQVSNSYAREHDGSGLGLAITKELVEMHGGTLFIESQLGVGTTVTVRLPYDAFKATQNR